MKKLIVIALLITFTASARIGETREQCLKRYGRWTSKSENPAKPKYSSMRFEKGIYWVQAHFVNNKCLKLSIGTKTWSDKAVAEFLKPYTRAYGAFTKTDRGFKSKNLQINVTRSKNYLIIEHVKYQKEVNSDKEKNENKSLKGL